MTEVQSLIKFALKKKFQSDVFKQKHQIFQCCQFMQTILGSRKNSFLSVIFLNSENCYNIFFNDQTQVIFFIVQF